MTNAYGGGGPMDLIVNGTAVARGSLGARRYYEGIAKRLDWPGNVSISKPAAWRSLERVSELLERGRDDALYWSPNHRGPMFAPNHVVTVLDCLNVEYTYRGDWRLSPFRKMFNVVLDRAVSIVAISRATGDAILRNYDVDERKITVIPGPIDVSLHPWRVAGLPVPPPVREEQRFVLMITNTLPHKNSANAARAVAKSQARCRGVGLRVVGSLDAAALSECAALGLKVDVVRGIDDSTLSQWLSNCVFMLAPSLDEGLDLPVAEALAHGANVLCSDISVHREFFDGYVRYFDPLRIDSIVVAIDEALAHITAWAPQGKPPGATSFADVAKLYESLFTRLSAELSDGRSSVR